MKVYRLHTDHHIAIGHTHLSDGKPCQDHALSGLIVEHGNTTYAAYAVVSDGCSRGGETDIGSRLITTLTAKAMKHDYMTGDTDVSIEAEAHDIAALLDLSPRDLEATHVHAVLDSNGQGYVMVKGDGVVALLHATGAMTVYRFEWANNLPYYPLYTGESLRKFYLRHGGREGMALTMTTLTVTPAGEVLGTDPIEYTVEQGAEGIRLPISEATDLSMIILFTDGVCQIDKMDWLDAVRGMTAFKNRAGVFAKRRAIRFIQDSMKIGHGPNDDLSMAVIAITPVELEKDAAMAEYSELHEKPQIPAEVLTAI